MPCLLKLSRNGKMRKVEVETEKEGAATGLEIRRAMKGEWDAENYTVTKLISAGKVVGAADAVAAGKTVMVIGVVRERTVGDPCVIVELVDVMGVVFSYLPLSKVRTTCSATCRAWRDMAEEATRQHPQRYSVEGGEVFDLFEQKPRSICRRFGVRPESIVSCGVHGMYLYMLADTHGTLKLPTAPGPVRMDLDSDASSAKGSDAAMLDEERAANDDGAQSGDSDGTAPDSDDDDDDDDAASVSSGESEGTAMTRDAAFLAELGCLGDPANDPLGTVKGPGATRKVLNDRHPRSYRLDASARVAKQASWCLICADLTSYAILWSLDCVHDPSRVHSRRTAAGHSAPPPEPAKPTETTLFRFPLASMTVSPAGVILGYATHFTLLHPQTGAAAGRLPRHYGWAFVFSGIKPVADLRLARSAAREFFVLQGSEVHTVDAHLRVTSSLRLPEIVADVVAVQPDMRLMVVRQAAGDLACYDVDKVAEVWAAPRGVLSHFSATNALLTVNGSTQLFDVENCHFRMPIPANKGAVLALLESPAPEEFATGVVCHGHIEEQRAVFNDPKTSVLSELSHDDEAWADIGLTDTAATHRYATNRSLRPGADGWEEYESLANLAPPRSVFNPALDFDSEHNVAARRYAAYQKQLSRLQGGAKQAYFRATPIGYLRLHAITRNVASKIPQWKSRAAAPEVDTVERGLLPVWSILVPFGPRSTKHAVCRHGNMLFVGFLERPTIGIYAVAIDRGFVKWRRAWQHSGATMIRIRVHQGVVCTEHSSATSRFMTFFSWLDGKIVHTTRYPRRNYKLN